jgi:hypothetical protein
VFTNDDPLNAEDPLGQGPRRIVVCLTFACLGAGLGMASEPATHKIPIPAGVEEAERVLEGLEPVPTEKPPTPTSKKNPPVNSNASSTVGSAINSAAHSAVKYAPAAAAGVGIGYLIVTYGLPLLALL